MFVNKSVAYWGKRQQKRCHVELYGHNYSIACSC